MRTDTKTFNAMRGAIARGYCVNLRGTVFGLSNNALSPHTDRDGYLRVNYKPLKKDKHTCATHIYIHQFQALYAYGQLEWSRAECTRHLDGNKLNNSRQNIVLGTHKENHNDKPASVQRKSIEGMQKSRSLLTREQWGDVINMHDLGHSLGYIGEVFGLTYKQIYNGIRYRGGG